MNEDYNNKCCCIYCKKIISYKGIFCHVDRVHLGKTKYSNGNNGKYHTEQYKENLSNAHKKRIKKVLGKIKKFDVVCHRCKKFFSVEEFENKFPMKNKYFCSKHCSNSRKHSTETKEKISNTLKGKSTKEKTFSTCEYCGITYIKKKKTQKYCSTSCVTKSKMSDNTNLKEYRKLCSFNFNLKEFPDEFDFSLVDKYGWYKPKNRGDNLNGVSRDHMISVYYGFENNIDPKILAHPANCKLMKHSENFSKYTKNSITFEELLIRISKWNTKYNANSKEI